MTTIWWLVESGWIAVVAIGLVWAETALLCLFATSARQRFKMLAGGALAGSFLMAAIACALRDYALSWIALFLTLSLLAHLVDVVGRLKSAR